MNLNHPDIPTYKIFINPKNYKEMKKDVWTDEYTPAKLIFEESTFKIGIAYRGNHTRKQKKKSYHIEFKNPHSFFGEKEIHLNAEYLDPSLIRNKLSFEFFQLIGVHAPNSKHIQLQLNGSKEGVYLQLESVDEIFLRKRGLPLGAIFYADNDDANFSLISPENKTKKSLDAGYIQKIGSKNDQLFLCELIYKINTLQKDDFKQEIIKYININQYLKWLAGVVCTQNYDGFIQNYALYRNGESGLFEMIPWDYDATWGRDIHGDVMECEYVPLEGFNTLTARILDVPEFRSFYRNIIEEILETKFTINFLEPIITQMFNQLKVYTEKDPYVGKLRNSEVDYILDFITKRSSYLMKKLNEF